MPKYLVEFVYHVEDELPSSYRSMVNDQTVRVSSPRDDMNVHQYFNLFQSFLRAVGFSDRVIMDGAAELAFNEFRDEKMMREVAENNDLVLSEDLPTLVNDFVDQFGDSIQPLREQVAVLQAENDELRASLEVLQDMKNAEPFLAKNEQSSYSIEYVNDPDDIPMNEEGYIRIRTNDPVRAWGGDKWKISPGTGEFGCSCPTLLNQNLPNNERWISKMCLVHGDLL
jgi:hypothetical protein